MLHVCNLNLKFLKVIHLPSTLPLIRKLFNVCFKSCCLNSFLGWAGFSVCLVECWLDFFFHLTSEKLIFPTWVFSVCQCVMRWYFSVTLWPREGLNHIISDRENHFLIEVRSENGSHMVQPGIIPKQKEIVFNHFVSILVVFTDN